MIYESGSALRFSGAGPDRTGGTDAETPPAEASRAPPGWRRDPTCFLLLASVNPGEQLRVPAPLAPIKGRTHKKTHLSMHKDALLFLLEHPPPPPLLTFSPFISSSPTPSGQPGPAARAYQSPLVCGASGVENGCCERAHFREPSSFEGA